MTRFALCSFAIASAIAVGCEAPELSTTSTTAPPPAPKVEEPVMVAGLPGEALPEDDYPVTDVPRKVHSHDPVQGRRSRQAAADGYSLGIGTTAAAGFYAKHQMIYLSIDQANQLYWPQHDFKYPPTHEAFMKDVVALALNGVPIPELAPGREYIYVPEMGDVGLQIRLTPGSPGSKLPPPEPGKEHIYDPKAVAAAGVAVPGLRPDGTLDPEAASAAAKVIPGDEAAGPAAMAEPAANVAAPAPAAVPAAEPAPEEPSPNIRERAGQIGGEANERTERALAPGGLAPAGGLGEGGL